MSDGCGSYKYADWIKKGGGACAYIRSVNKIMKEDIMKREDNVASAKQYVKVPKVTFILQAIFILAMAVIAVIELPVTIFGLPLESFIVTWISFVILAISSIVWLKNQLKKEDK